MSAPGHSIPEQLQNSDPVFLVKDHRRTFHENRYVYPVLSRRSRGLSIGINLNPDKICNFACIYCQVDRETPPPTPNVELNVILGELEHLLDDVTSGLIFKDDRFKLVPPHLRRLNDIAFSGDGEPTSCPQLLEIMSKVAEIKVRRQYNDVKLILISNASLFHRPRVRRALEILDRNGGEIWAKLDAGTASFFRHVARSSMPFGKILANIVEAGKSRPLVIQSLFFSEREKGPDEPEIAAYIDCLRVILWSGAKIDRVQVYTVARQPASSALISPLADEELGRIGELIMRSIGRPFEVFGSGLES